MANVVIELPSHAEQTAFNLRRWAEMVKDPELQRYVGRVETDRFGQVIISPPPAPDHGHFQATIAHLLKQLTPHGRRITECPIPPLMASKGRMSPGVRSSAGASWRAVAALSRHQRFAWKSFLPIVPCAKFARNRSCNLTLALRRSGFAAALAKSTSSRPAGTSSRVPPSAPPFRRRSRIPERPYPLLAAV
jgi:hypothetical protein